jgi:N-acetyl-anhydromuramoyl-L-alanine amidase
MEAVDKRPRSQKEWVGIIIHHTGLAGMKPGAWAEYFQSIVVYLSRRDDAFVSAHYVISRDGIVMQLVDPSTHEAFHAGKSSYWHPILRRVVPDWNRHAIGIELIGDGNKQDYSQEQYESLIELCRQLRKKFPSIHPLAIVGHENIAPDRKVDPGVAFNWDRFFSGLFK